MRTYPGVITHSECDCPCAEYGGCADEGGCCGCCVQCLTCRATVDEPCCYPVVHIDRSIAANEARKRDHP